MPYQILRHLDYEITSGELPLAVRRKAEWAIVQLGVRGRTPSTKGTIGLPLPWRRSPVQGSHYYLWWINAVDGGVTLNGRRTPNAEGAILVHSIRHHDETDSSPVVGDADDYETLNVGHLDPRFDDQEEVALVAQDGDLSFTVVEGMPGSGKTVALLFLARDLAARIGTQSGTRKVRYITYTERLKRAARELFDALGPEIAQHVSVLTINDVVKELTGVDLRSSPYTEIETFVRELDLVNPADLGPWREVPLSLYTELRGQVAGRTFPAAYQLPAHRAEQMRRSGGRMDAERYGQRRKLGTREAQLAVNLAERFANRFFLDQKLAANALEKLSQSQKAPAWLAHTDALIIDEVQDFTLLQIALVAEMAALRRKSDPTRPLALTVAGDESQIVQPTGFKWGVTKDLIRERLGVNPQSYHFDAQRRAPPLLARLADTSWNFYSRLPKDLRPSTPQTTALDGAAPEAAAERGLIILTPIPMGFAEPGWAALLDELVARPGRAIIDLGETLAKELALPAETHPLREVIFEAREIKGLERGTVLIFGLEQTWQQVAALSDEDESDRLAHFEARRLIDQMRVALSRSTARLILFEPPEAAVLAELGLNPAEDMLRLSLAELVEQLQGEQMTDTEMVLALQEEADDLADRGRLDEALRRNRRAAALIQRAGSQNADLQHALRLQESDLLMRLAEAELAQGRIARAQETHQQAEALLAGVSAESMPASLAERWQTLSQALFDASHSEFALLIDEAERALAAQQWADAVLAATSAYRLVYSAEGERETPPAQLPEGPERDRAQRAISVNLRAFTAHAEALAAQGGDPAAIASALRWVTGRYDLLSDPIAALIFAALAERYTALPERATTPETLRRLLDLTSAALQKAAVPPTLVSTVHSDPTAAPAAFAHLARWLDEAFGALGGTVAFYGQWATAAAQLARLGAYPGLDDKLWDLEERYKAAGSPPGPFAAFLAAYNGDPTTASQIWEKLGELELAIESARDAGDFERTARLLKAAHRSPPEEFATAVKAMRQLQSLQALVPNLRPAERRALAEELARLHSLLNDG